MALPEGTAGFSALYHQLAFRKLIRELGNFRERVETESSESSDLLDPQTFNIYL